MLSGTHTSAFIPYARFSVRTLPLRARFLRDRVNGIQTYAVVDTAGQEIGRQDVTSDASAGRGGGGDAPAAAHEFFYTTDWFSYNIPIWEQHLANLRGKPHLRGIEVGSYQGRSAVWLMQNIFTANTSQLTCVDTFHGSVEHNDDERRNMLQIFSHNTWPFRQRIRVLRGMSQQVLRTLPYEPAFDFAYIDGAHDAASVLEDAVLLLPLLKPGAILIFDDYMWRSSNLPDTDRPQIAIEAIASVYRSVLDVVHVGYQAIMRKR